MSTEWMALHVIILTHDASKAHFNNDDILFALKAKLNLSSMQYL